MIYLCRIFLLACFTVFCVALVPGCSNNKTQVTGTVRFEDGSPLTVGTVVMQQGDRICQGDLQADGSFSMGVLKKGEGITPGSYQVAIQGAMADMSTYLIDPKFATPSTSDITMEVRKGEKNTLDIVVSPPAKKHQ